MIFVADLDDGAMPEPDGNAPILASASCISVICHPEVNGPTDILLRAFEQPPRSDWHDDHDLPDRPPDFDGSLATPYRNVVVSTSLGTRLLRAAVPGETTRLRIWIDDPVWPKAVAIAYG